MGVVFAGQGDAGRTLALLWRAAGSPTPRPRGPKPALSVDAIVDAAIEVADEQGMAALSMRAVGERLGRTAMALYTYVPNKTELIDLMHDRALAELPTTYATDEGWRAATTRWAGDTWAFYLRHPWVLQVSQARPALGPHEYAALETVVGILRATRLPAQGLRRIVGTLFHLVRGAARTAAEARQAASETGVADTEWWSTRAALLQEVAPDFAESYPMVTWLESAPDTVPAQLADESAPYLEGEAKKAFDAGLEVLLDGVEAAVARAGG
ncbi:TetR/AcrR family transcriptional regulator [Streptomyces sp. NPDC002889]|uniref:TetR/AcrR family transcriptional regulator n=1 Tax=Streptomyces sp. NPDC002889 TaxID=3364669 RepID=UPI00369F0D0F